MGFWTLLEVASMPIIQMLLISGLGALMATGYWNLLPADARRSLNKIVFIIFTPCLMFASLAKTVTLQDIISWWFMPVNVGITFFLGGTLGWIACKLLRPKPYLEGLLIATCSAGNLGNLLLIVVPVICNEKESPFGDRNVCSSVGLSYASFSMALGGFYIWTYTYQLIRTSTMRFKALQAEEEAVKAPNNDLNATEEAHLLNEGDEESVPLVLASNKSIQEIQASSSQESDNEQAKVSCWAKTLEVFHKIVEELMAPSTVAAIFGFIFGATKFLRNLIIGDTAPLRVIQDSIQLLGEGTIPCITLILGGNLIQGLRSSKIKPSTIIAVVCVRYIILPGMGMWIVKAANSLGFLSSDPLYQFILMVQYTLPPAMSIGTITQLFEVGQEECSVIFLWTYLVAALALTFWSTVFMWILT